MRNVQVILLTHERELDRPTNTGRLVLEVVGEPVSNRVRRVLWRRKEPDDSLLALLKRPRTALLYPASEVQCDGREAGPLRIAECDTFILLDGTWQEARKMYNRSPYLHKLPRIELDTPKPSRFTLRRNQREGCLCTAECIAHLLQAKGLHGAARRLETAFDRFLLESP